MKPYGKKGASYDEFVNDTKAVQAFYAMRDSLHENACITSIGYDAAADNKEGALILFTDAS